MKNLKLELFNFRKNLSPEEVQISAIIEGHMNALTNLSEKQVISSLNEQLNQYTFDKSVKAFLESVNDDVEEYQLLYELKHLYNILDSKNSGMMLRQPLNVLLQIINLDSDQDRMDKILNDLAVYDWVPEIKLFVHNLIKSPEQKENLLSGGRAESVYTVVEQVEDGYLCLVRDSWFLLTENNIEKTILENHVQDQEKLRSLRNLESAMKMATINDERINFRISENLSIGLSTNRKGVIFINDDEMNKETTLESLFASPIIPIVNRAFYPILLECSNNLNKFVEMDVVKRVTNLMNPHLEVFAFNYKNSIYLYRCDDRYGNSFYKYESAMELINEIKNELNYDLTYFYENNLSREVIVKRKLEDKEREITLKLEDVQLNIDKVENSIKMIGESNTLKVALGNLRRRKDQLEGQSLAIQELQYREREVNRI
jgi:hypothetical protein